MGYTGQYLMKVLKFLLVSSLISQFSHSVLSVSMTPWTAARQASRSISKSGACSNSSSSISDATQPSHPLQTMTVLLLSNVDSFSFSSLIAMARTSKTMLNNSSESGHPCLAPDLRENAFSFSPLKIMFPVDLSYLAFIMLKQVPSMPVFWRVFFF